MEDQNKQQSQSRFLLAAVLSMLVLTGWMFFFAPEPTEKEQANANTNATQQANSNTEKKESTETKKEEEKQQAETAEQQDENESSADENPNKTITVKTPLYEATIDSKGAVAKSWILKLNDTDDEKSRKPLYADGSTKDNKIPLELVSPEGLKRNLAPFQLSTGDENLDKVINQKNYKVSEEDETVEIKGDESKKIDFVYEGANGVKVTKTFVFNANNYIADLSVKLTKDDKPVPNTKLLIGPSIGDQGINRYTFYTVEPEGVYNVNDSSNREYSVSITEDSGTGSSKVEGAVDWAGVGDTYFAMAAIPNVKTNGLEFRTIRYEEEVRPFYDGIIAWITRSQSTKTTKHLMTAYVPINTDGATNKIYTGTKDYFVLHKYSDKLSQVVGRTVDIEEFINYGYLGFFTRPLSVPILYCLRFLNNFVNNYGIAIIIFTLVFYSLLFPFRWFSSKSFKKASKNAPKLKEIQDKQKELQKKGVPMDDPQMRELQMEQLRMMKGAVPIGGCLPMLLQFPLLIALYITVSIYLGFRQESFLWLPDLSAGDPYHILEFAFAISMVLSFKFSPTTPAVTPEQKMQQNMMTYIMPIMMLWIMWSAPSGLLLYWFAGNIIMFAQQMIINYMNKDDSGEEDKEEKKEILRKKPKPATS